jgi:membrane protein
MEGPATHILAPGGDEVPVGRWKAHWYRKPFGEIRWCDIRSMLAESAIRWTRHNAPRLGAALAFYTLLSLMPLLLVAISIAGLIFGPRAAQTGVMAQLQMLFGEQRAKIVEALLSGAQSTAGGVAATALGMFTLMFGASGMLNELRDALNTIWEVPVSPMTTMQEILRVVRKRLWSIALVLGIGIVLTVSLVFGTWISAAGTLYASILPANAAVLHLLNGLLSFVAVTVFFCAIYRIVPEVSIGWRDVILGAAVTALLFTPGNVLLGLYLGRASFSSTYGAAGSTVVLALWVYYSSQVFFFGAEFTKVFVERCGPGRGVGRHLVELAGAQEPPTNGKHAIVLVEH